MAGPPISAPPGGQTRRAGFRDLPAELRNRIYDLAADENVAIRTYERGDQCYAYRNNDTFARLSRQTRTEYLSRYYRRAVFRVWWRAGNLHIEEPSWGPLPGTPKKERTFELWLSEFGNTRVPLLRRFGIVTEQFGVDVNLKNKESPIEVYISVDLVYGTTRVQAESSDLEEVAKECKQVLASGLEERADESEFISADGLAALVQCLRRHDLRIMSVKRRHRKTQDGAADKCPRACKG